MSFPMPPDLNLVRRRLAYILDHTWKNKDSWHYDEIQQKITILLPKIKDNDELEVIAILEPMFTVLTRNNGVFVKSPSSADVDVIDQQIEWLTQELETCQRDLYKNKADIGDLELEIPVEDDDDDDEEFQRLYDEIRGLYENRTKLQKRLEGFIHEKYWMSEEVLRIKLAHEFNIHTKPVLLEIVSKILLE